MGTGLTLTSGRLIALGRLLLGALFLAIVWIDTAQTGQFSTRVYALLIAYVTFSAALVLLTWRSWWLDAHLAGPAHAVDIALFTVLVSIGPGDKSPFFPFFVFVLLAAAIRWGWRATTLTAILLTILYFIAGALAATMRSQFNLDSFVVRTGYLVILSLVLIWFGANYWRSRRQDPSDEVLTDLIVDPTPLESSLRSAMEAADAPAGAFVWSKRGAAQATAIAIGGEDAEPVLIKNLAAPTIAATPFLYNLAKHRALRRDGAGNLRPFPLAASIPPAVAAAAAMREGLAAPVVSEAGSGQLYLEAPRALGTDHLELGERIATSVAAHMQRQALMKAVEDSAEARSRLAVARDLHDSVVQFLAGAAFRLEAMKRSMANGRDPTPDLDELKQLMLQEQGELRSFISALRSGPETEMTELAKDLQSLAGRLSRQWDVQCTFSLQPGKLTVPTRLHFDTQQLVREAVANAVRHAGAKNISIRLGGRQDEVRIDFINDGAAFPRGGSGKRLPLSLRERVEAAGGALELSRGMGVTKLSISLPAAGAAA